MNSAHPRPRIFALLASVLALTACSDKADSSDQSTGGSAGSATAASGGAGGDSSMPMGGDSAVGSGGSAAASGGGGSSGVGGRDSGLSDSSVDLDADDPLTPDASTAEPGWNIVAMDTALRTYLDYVEVPASGEWTPEADRVPSLAQWEEQTDYTALRFVPFTPGDQLTPEQIMTLLPAVARAPRAISITSAPYNAQVAPADASEAIQAALDDAAEMASEGEPVDVLVPPGTFNHSEVLTVGADVRLRRSPEDTGGVLHGTDPLHATVHLTGDRSGALFLVLTSSATARDTGPPGSTGVWVGYETADGPFIRDTLVVGTEVEQSAGAHFFALRSEGDLWAFNYAHDGFADTFHHTGGSRNCQVIGNRAQTSADRGDDFYAFVGYQGDGDAVHHCTCIANWGRDGHARGLAAVGAGFIEFAHNDIDRTQWAGIYLAREQSYQSYGTFDIDVIGNTVAHANLDGSHSGLLAFGDDPGGSSASRSFGMLSNQVRRIRVRDNTFIETAAGIGNGFGIEVRATVDTGEVTGNTLTGNQAPQLVVDGTDFDEADNTVAP